MDVAEGLNYLHTNNTTHGNLKGVYIFFESFWASSVTFCQLNVLVDHDGHARLTNFEFTSIVRWVNPATSANEYTAAWAAPEILEGGDGITREADVFAFGMVVVEVSRGVLGDLVLGVDGRFTDV